MSVAVKAKLNIRPLQDRIVVKREEEQVTKGGIVIPDSASSEKSILGLVMAVGPGKVLDNGSRLTVDVKIGDRVVFGKYAGTEVKVEGEEYLILRQDDIVGVVD